MTIINVSQNRLVQIGYEGEDKVTILRFGYSEKWLENGEGIFTVRVLRNGENQAYNAQLIEDDRENYTIDMTVTDVELSKKGYGEMQVVYSGADFVKKSPIYSYYVSRAVDEVSDPPAQDVYTQIIESLSDLQTDVQGLADAVDGIGNLSDLTTEAKTDLVSAINEVNAKGGMDITVDDRIIPTSTNPVQNRAISVQLASIGVAIGKKADTATVSTLADAVNGLDSDVRSLQTIVQGKADTQTVTALSDTVSGLQTAVQGKADTSTVTALSGTVSSLSDTTQQYMEYTNSAITDLQDNKASKSYVDGELATKANVQTVTALSGTVTDLQANKADKTYVDTELAGKASTAVATTSTNGLMSAQDKSKLDEVSLLKEQIYNSYPNVEAETASVVSITDGADDIPVKSLVVGVEPVQDLHGYDNPWPAGGGLNKVPLFESKTVNGVTLTNDNGEITLNGTATTDAYFDVDVNILVPNGSTLYLCCFNPVATDSRVSLFAISDNGNPQKNMNVVNGMTKTTVTADTTISKIRLRAPDGVTLTNFKCSPMLQIGDTAPTVFSPYENICPITGWTGAVISHSGADMTNPTIYPVTFPTEAGTVYGGQLDVTTGVLTVTKGLIASYAGEALPGAWISDRDVYAEGVTPTTGAQIVYELATPVTYQLTPTEVITLLGSNSVWADTGDTSLAYRADTKLYIDGICADCNSMLAPVESTYIATRNYTTGKLLIVDNTLYKVTANIANGGTITAGINVVATTLSEVIASLS